MKDWTTVQTSLSGIANKARDNTKYRFRNLYGMLDETLLHDSWGRIKKTAAAGVDGVSAADFEADLDEHIRQLVADLKGKRYKARFIRRKYIPKGQGKMRPLGIPATRDKLLQLAAARILTAIYEQDFLRLSYGYRPGRGARDAVKQLTVKLQFGKYAHVVDADIKGFFDTIDHEWMVRMLEERVDDKAFIGLIRKWLKAGILEEDGKRMIKPGSGTPQGGIVSPILANIYLHYVLDIWFHRVFRKSCPGEACMIRYADDCVWAFEHKEDATRFYSLLKERLGKFKLELSEEKSSIIEFSSADARGGRFCFLGFEYYWSRDRNGKSHVKRQTSTKKFRSSILKFKEWIRTNRSLKLRELIRRLNMKLRGYYNYFGVLGNSRMLHKFDFIVMGILRKWLSRRSQRGSINWERFKKIKERIIRPFINENKRRRVIPKVVNCY